MIQVVPFGIHSPFDKRFIGYPGDDFCPVQCSSLRSNFFSCPASSAKRTPQFTRPASSKIVRSCCLSALSFLKFSLFFATMR